jgi:hypothetical protein
MAERTEDVQAHWTRSGVLARIDAALTELGHDPQSLNPEILATLEHLHSGGLATTRRQANRVALSEDYLVLKRASASRPSGEWSDDDYDVLADAVVVGRIFLEERRGCGRSSWSTTRIARRHTATRRRARQRWQHSLRAGDGNRRAGRAGNALDCTRLVRERTKITIWPQCDLIALTLSITHCVGSKVSQLSTALSKSLLICLHFDFAGRIFEESSECQPPRAAWR